MWRLASPSCLECFTEPEERADVSSLSSFSFVSFWRSLFVSFDNQLRASRPDLFPVPVSASRLLCYFTPHSPQQPLRQDLVRLLRFVCHSIGAEPAPLASRVTEHTDRAEVQRPAATRQTQSKNYMPMPAAAAAAAASLHCQGHAVARRRRHLPQGVVLRRRRRQRRG